MTDQELRMLCRLPGADFRAAFPRLAEYLAERFPELVGLPQSRAHFSDDPGRTTDPIEHTLEAMAILDVSGLPLDLVELLRVTLLLHDVGKARDAFDPTHARLSAPMAAPLLVNMGYGDAERALIDQLIVQHNLIGLVCQGMIAPERAADELGHMLVWDLHRRIALADISSIRGLRQVVPSVHENIERVREILAARDADHSLT